MAASGVTGVSARGIVKTFGATAALRGVDVELRPGLTLIEGSNGSGKSTLLRILGTILRPTAGEVRYQPMGKSLAAVRSCLGWLSHEPLAYEDLSGRANIELCAGFHGVPVAEAWRQAQHRFELGRFAERPLRTNSRGQRQRIALARALVHQPTLILLDEPTTGLDRAGVARLFTLIDEELARGVVMAVVSHEPEAFDDRVQHRVILERGRLMQAAPVVDDGLLQARAAR